MSAVSSLQKKPAATVRDAVVWTHKDLVGLQDLTAAEITHVLDTAAAFKDVGAREIKKVPALRGQTMVNFFVERLEASVINAGDGAHEHPTQALLDTFTIREKLGCIAGIHVAIIGDILFSRVARSNIHALLKLGARVTLIGPRTLVPREFEP